MPQNNSSFIGKTAAGAAAPLLISPTGHTYVSGLSAQSSSLGLVAASTTLLKAGMGHVIRVVVTTAGTTAGAVYDSATTAGIGAANMIATLPNTVGPINLEFPYLTGLVVVMGAGQTASIAYN